MRALFLYYRYPLYPQGSYFQEFLNQLAGSVETVYLIATRYPKGDFDKPENLKIFWASSLTIKYLGELFFMIAALFKAITVREFRQVDVVNSVGPRGLLAGWYLKRRYRIPLICTIELLNEKGTFLNNILYEISRFLMVKIPVDKFICWSNYYRENHLREWGITDERIAVIPAGVNIKTYSPEVDGGVVRKRYAPNDPLIVFAKPLYNQNTESAKLLVRAAALLKDKIKVKLLIGGGGGQSEVQQLAENLGVADRVAFMPPTPFPEIPKYIAAADLVVLPFTYAPTTSRSLLEAMALGKPIVTVLVGEIGHVLEDGVNALLVVPDPEEIAGAVRKLLQDRALADKIGSNARRKIEEKFSLNGVVAQTVGCFEDIVR